MGESRIREKELVNKKELRKEVLALRDALSQKERCEKSEKIIAQVLELDEFRKTNKVLLYASMRSEVETDEIYHKAKALGKEIYYPRVMGDKMEFYLVEDMAGLEVSTFNVREPQIEPAKQFSPEEGDELFVLMPGVVFDKAGNRIGYGGGCYDKYLHWLEDRVKSENICKVAIAYACQMVDLGKIDVEEHDVRPNYIVTESDTYTIKVE